MARCYLYLLLLCSFWASPNLAQTPQLDQLLREAEARYPTVLQRSAEIRAARAALAEAKTLGGPRLSLGGTYTVAAGGRSIDLPVGDLLNPVYGALNQLTQSNSFPSIENVEEQFLPNNFYDLRLRATYPLYQPTIKINAAAKEQQLRLAELTATIDREDVRRDVRVAYWQLQAAYAAADVYEDAQGLIAESLRTTRSLIANGDALPTARLRLEAERARVGAELDRVRARAANAAAQLNYLTGRPLDTPAGRDTLAVALPELLTGSTTGRTELQLLETGLALNALARDAEQQYFRPTVGLQLDAGSQAFDFGFSPYALLGLSVEIPLYDHGAHRRRLERIAAERDAQLARQTQTRRALALEAEVLRRELVADLAQVRRYVPAVAAARRVYRDTERLYREGLTNYLNLVDARTNLTQQELQQTIATYTAYTRAAALQRAFAE